MQEMAVIRQWQFTIMRNNLTTYAGILERGDEQTFSTVCDGGDGWTVRQVLGHLRDFEGIFMERCRLMLTEDNPALPFPDPDDLAAENDYNTIPTAELFAAMRDKRLDYFQFLEGLQESDWEQIGVHPTRGNFTIHDQLFLSPLHDSIHLEQIAKILKEK